MSAKLDNLIERLEEVRQRKELPKAKFGPVELDIAAVTYRKWTYGENKPDAENTLKIIDYLEKNEQ